MLVYVSNIIMYALPKKVGGGGEGEEGPLCPPGS